MKEFRQLINKRILRISFMTLLCAAIILANHFFADGTTMEEGFMVGFQGGIASALILVGVYVIFRYRRLLNNEEALKLEYIKENDERTKEIRRKAGLPMTLIMSCIMIVAGIVAGYYNSYVFYTLIAAASFQMLLTGVIKVYYMKKM